MTNSRSKFRETEVGLVPEDWEILSLDDVCYPVSDTYNLSDKDEIVFLNTGDIFDGKVLNHNKVSTKGLPGQAKKRISRGDILFSEIRPANKRFACIDFDADDYVVSTKLMVLKPKQNIDVKYLLTHITSPEILSEFQIIAESRSGTFPQITFDAVKATRILMPPVEEQQKIAEVLGALDDKIELNRKMNKTLESLAQAIFKKWFIDDADPNWETKKLGDVVRIRYGKNLPTTKLQESGYPVFGGNGQIGFYDKFLYKLPQVLVACRGAASGKVNFSLPESFVTNNSLALEYEQPLNYEFLKYFALNADFYSCVSGSAQPQITIDSLHGYEMTLPDKETLAKFQGLVSPITKKLLVNDIEIETLSQIRDSLLPRLMSGKLRVK